MGHNEKMDNFCCKPYYQDNLDVCPQKILHEDNDKKPNKYYYKILQLPFCFCGRRKDRLKAFCPKCHYLLPPERKRLLNSKVGEGFGAGYDACRRYLEEDLKKQSSFLGK